MLTEAQNCCAVLRNSLIFCIIFSGCIERKWSCYWGERQWNSRAKNVAAESHSQIWIYKSCTCCRSRGMVITSVHFVNWIHNNIYTAVENSTWSCGKTWQSTCHQWKVVIILKCYTNTVNSKKLFLKSATTLSYGGHEESAEIAWQEIGGQTKMHWWKLMNRKMED